MKSFALPVLFLLTSPNVVHAAEQPVVGPGLGTFSVTLLFILVLGAAAWALKKYGPMARVRKSTGLDVVGRMPLGPKATLALVRVGKTILLLGITQNQINLIKDLGENPFEKAMDASLDNRQVTP